MIVIWKTLSSDMGSGFVAVYMSDSGQYSIGVGRFRILAYENSQN